ncbi:TPA: AAA family ATPase, partial [Streptococcus agalactiae]
DTLTLEKSKADDKIKSIRRHLSDLRKQIVNTSAAVEGINTLLTDTGFQGFFIREKEDIPNVYEVIRTGTGKVAENLSEGERNFIAFLYFHQLVLGSLEADSDVKDKIVVIDDPVSSMDSSTLFVVGALVRDMIAICNPDYVTKEHPKDYIKQIFILTHNAFFHQEVTYNQAQHYRFVSFFEIVKLDNNSDVILCTQSNRETPSIKENRNPIQNSYAALWDTYKEVSSPNTLVNVIRQILDYYFLQLCGYSGIDIKDIILKNHRDDFITILPDGTEDCSDLHMAASLLQYLCTSNDRISDGLNFIHASVDTDSCRRIFENIFRHMGQGQHFDMMMKR